MVGWFHSTSRVAIVGGDYEVLKMVQRQPSGHISLCRRFQLECAACPTVAEHSKRGGVIPIYPTQLNLKSIPKQGEIRGRDEQEKRVYRTLDFGGLH